MLLGRGAQLDPSSSLKPQILNNSSLIISSPARFYVSMVVKMILIEFLTKYDFKLADDKMPATFNWKLYEVPHPRLSFHIRRRAL